MNPGYDFIGDVHGYAEKLITLLTALGYKANRKGYTHPDRQAFFIGDYINRGPGIPRTLEIIKTMIDSGAAQGIMGNHEYYAVCFNTAKKGGGYLRRHSIKNILNQYETFRQFKSDEKQYQYYLEWFLTLPVFVEQPRFRAVHACWDSTAINVLKKRLDNGRLKLSQLEESRDNSSELCTPLHIALKGKEILLRASDSSLDIEPEQLTKIRMKWWEDPVAKTYRALTVQPDLRLPEKIVPTSDLPSVHYYDKSEKPVFFGHYGLTSAPALFRDNICCLDFGVAKEGRLAAYRYDGEAKLSPEKLVFV